MPVKQTSAVKTVHRLLFDALLELRSQGHEHRNPVVFHLADLFHNIVLEMENAAQGCGSYEDVLALLEERAREKGCQSWVEQRLAEIDNP